MKSLHVAPLNIFSLRLNLIVLAGVSLAPVCLNAQSAPAKPAASATSSNSASGFSIETEMLTYRALESNSEAIACDVAAYLHGTTVNFSNPPQGAACNVAGTNASSSVMVFPFDRAVFSDFQLWRADMQTMAEIERRGAAACSAPKAAPEAGQQTPPPGVSSRGLTAAPTPSTLLGLTPGGSAVAGAQGILGLFASDHSAEPVGGTIEDQAMMDNVSRELRSVDVPVMMPSVYTPYALSSIDPARSPFANALDKVLHTRDCLVASKGANDADVKNIDGFLESLAASPSAPAPAKAVAAPASAAAAAPATAAPAAAPAAASSGPSHLQSVLSADGLAESLGADPQTGLIPDSAPQHILLVKALESGGSVNHSTNIFGTKMSFSGGSVGTFALFDLKGQLECSGNVYDYAGYASAKNFEQQLHAFKPDPSAQVLFQRGSCRPK